MNLKKRTFLALGDSYTIGTGTPIDLNWPNQLKDKLILDEFALLDVSIIAQNGWTTSDLLAAIKKNSQAQHDLVSLMIGVNNQFQKQPFEVFRKEFKELLQIAIKLSAEQANIFVVSIPDYSVTSFGSGNPVAISNDIDRYNEFIEKTCKENDIRYVDVTDISRDLGASKQVLADDELHPNPFQYSRWLENIVPAVRNLFEDDSP